MTSKTILATLLATISLAGTPVLAQTETAPAESQATDSAEATPSDSATEKGDTKHEHKGDRRAKRSKHHSAKRMHMAPPFLAQFDTDEDGKISADEAKQGVNALINDYGSDDALDPEQFQTMLNDLSKPMTERFFKRLDTNGDGKIDTSEAEAFAERFSGARVMKMKAGERKDDSASDAAEGEAEEAPAN